VGGGESGGGVGGGVEPISNMVFTETELAYLASQRLGRLATAQPNGTLQVSPVGFTDNDATSTVDIVGFNRDKSPKFRNIEINGSAAFVGMTSPRSNPGASDASRSEPTAGSRAVGRRSPVGRHTIGPC
jgi:Pyridoxamine 5'-phosphate oxidase